MTAAKIQALIDDTKEAVDEYEELTGLEATALRNWLASLEQQLAAAHSRELRMRQDETVAEMEVISNAVHRRDT